MNRNKAAITVHEFARDYGISRPAAYALTKQPGFPAVHIGRKIIIPVNRLQEWLDKGGTAQRGA